MKAERNSSSNLTDPREKEVFKSFSNGGWRTILSLAEKSGLPESFVQSVLADHSELIRKWPYPNKQGQKFVALASEPVTVRELLARVRKYLEFPYKG